MKQQWSKKAQQETRERIESPSYGDGVPLSILHRCPPCFRVSTATIRKGLLASFMMWFKTLARKHFISMSM